VPGALGTSPGSGSSGFTIQNIRYRTLPITEWMKDESMSDGREEREEREKLREQEERENREDRIDRFQIDQWEQERDDS